MIGSTLAHYRITAKLGEGGMGEVYRATDTKLDREVAIKVLPAAFTEDKERLARFEREAKLLAQLQHPNIASIFGIEDDHGTKALIMELVEGPTLAERLEQGALPLDESLSLAKQIAEALEEAHEKGIVHRDLKPQNVKASKEGRVKVLDFGLAKAMDPMGAASGAASASQLAASPTLTLGATVQGVILGTAAYMAPEQAKGMAVDKRGDIWAFGVVLYEMLSGTKLFDAPTVPETLAQVLMRAPDLEALPASTPPALRRLLRRCLERAPKNRLHDIADARLVIDDLIAGKVEPGAEAVAAASPAGGSRALRLAALGAIVVAAAAGFVVGRGGNAPAATETRPVRALSFRKLTFRPGFEANPRLSPDGRSLFYQAEREGGGDSDIFFVPVGGKRPIDLTADSKENDWWPAVSPDGETIAFRSERDGGGIYLMGTTGESPRRLIDDCFDPEWSPDGSRIVCTTNPAGDPFDRSGRGRLRVVELTTGAVSELTSEGDAAAPAWSPDGRWIAAWGLRAEGGQRDLWLVPAKGGERRELTSDAAFDWNPVWSADSAWLYFLSDRGGLPNLWRLRIDGATGRAVGEPENVVLPSEFVIMASRTGERWVYASRALRSTIEKAAFDPVKERFVGAPERVLEMTTELQSLDLSPDGSTIAYTTVFPRQDLFVAALGGGSPVQLTDDPARDRFASWDPDGSRILFTSSRGGRYEQWAIRPDGSGLEQLTRSTEEISWAPGISPDHGLLMVLSDRGTSIFDAGGPTPWESFERVPPVEAPEPETFLGFFWSPSGDRVAGITVGKGNAARRGAIWRRQEGTVERLEHLFFPVGWFPDGRRLLAASPEGTVIVDVASGERRPISGGPRLRNASASSDLTVVVAYSVDDQTDLWLAEGIE